MKKSLLSIICVAMLASCGNGEQQNFKAMSFEELFTEITPNELTDNVFKLFSKDFTVITAGDSTHYNSMTAGWGGIGILFQQPAAWCVLRANRYTLELMRRDTTYTLSFFPDEYKEQVLFLGSKSGRDSQKMQETTLTAVQTPLGNMTYKEARLVFECSLSQITTVSPDDFYSPDNKQFIEDGYAEAHDYHKIVFGEITKIWVQKQAH
ncbi:MAG: flavin reductase [Prevotellaceae bacterium]|jgi:flavin reductase (DIM6/NTAB) family NADH-FMN oxidoreductase RutF|nr:flavin reductase [Prevotellaceae bacterium]